VPQDPRRSGERGVPEALRAAIERTLAVAGKPARAGSAALRPERATQLLDEVARRGLEARDELARRGQDARQGLARRGQEAGAGLARRGQGARDELAERLETLERRLASLEDALRTRPKPKPKAED
jgi:polyhydroxyalkanoate synthesis regulator phasin